MVFSFHQHRPTQALIYLDHLEHNFKVLRGLQDPGLFFCPMVKANAYGHGDIEVARRLESLGVEAMGVGLIEEGILLRGLGIKTELLFFGLMDRAGVQACLEAGLTPVLSSWDQIRELAEVLAGRELKVHLKFDTGMHRLGFETTEASELFEFFKDHPNFHLAGVMTHLHSGEDASDPEGESFAQLREFQRLASIFQRWSPKLHALNSAGLLNFAKLRRQGHDIIDGVSLRQGARPGVALYGVSPLDDDPEVPLKPVMSLRSCVVRLKRVQVGEGVSYGQTWRASRPSWIGVVPVGYADGYHRAASNRAHVLVDGRRLPVVGNVCMDYLMIDLTELVGAGSADPFLWKEVTLFGYDSHGNLLSPKELAACAQTVSWEVLTSVGERVPRKVL